MHAHKLSHWPELTKFHNSFFGSNHSLALVCCRSMWQKGPSTKGDQPRKFKTKLLLHFSRESGILDPWIIPKNHATSRIGGKPYGSLKLKKLFPLQSCGENVDSSEIPRWCGNLYESIKPFVNPEINYQTFSMTAATGSDYTPNNRCPRHFGTWNSFCVMPQLILRAICKRCRGGLETRKGYPICSQPCGPKGTRYGKYKSI